MGRWSWGKERFSWCAEIDLSFLFSPFKIFAKNSFSIWANASALCWARYLHLDSQKWKPLDKQFSPGCKRTPRCPWWSWTVNIDSLLLHPNKEGHLGVWQQMKVTTMQRRMRKRFNSRRQRRFEPNLQKIQIQKNSKKMERSVITNLLERFPRNDL